MEAGVGGVQRRTAPVGPSLTRQDVINDYNTRPCQRWFWGEQPSCCELHHPNNIILFMRLVDRSHVWLAWGSAQVNWKPELCNGAGSWADIVPLVITQEACVSVYRLHLRFTAPVWEWNIRGQVMDVSISGTDAVGMDHSYHWTHLIFSRPCVSLNATVDDSTSLCLHFHALLLFAVLSWSFFMSEMLPKWRSYSRSVCNRCVLWVLSLLPVVDPPPSFFFFPSSFLLIKVP